MKDPQNLVASFHVIARCFGDRFGGYLFGVGRTTQMLDLEERTCVQISVQRNLELPYARNEQNSFTFMPIVVVTRLAM